MVKQTASPTAFQEMLTEHAELMIQLAMLLKWWNEVQQLGIPRFGEMGGRLSDLRKQLKVHFDDEEAGGYMSDVLALAPHLSSRAEKLRGQHRQLLTMLDEFISKLRANEPSFGGWIETRQQLDEFLTALREHEVAENNLVQSAFDDDAAAVD